MRASEVRVHRAGGIAAHNCRSTTSGSSESAMPMRFATRSTCRSTGSPGTPSAWPSTTFAVLRPTPGSFVRAAISAGTSPPWSLDERPRHADERFRFRAEEAGRMNLRLERRASLSRARARRDSARTVTASRGSRADRWTGRRGWSPPGARTRCDSGAPCRRRVLRFQRVEDAGASRGSLHGRRSA